MEVSALEVVGLISKCTGGPEHKICPKTKINTDLGVDGDDADELLFTYRDKFGVDLSGFDFTHHFGPEGGPPLSFVAFVIAFGCLFALWRWAGLPLAIVIGVASQCAIDELWPESPLYVRDLVEGARNRVLRSRKPSSIRRGEPSWDEVQGAP